MGLDDSFKGFLSGFLLRGSFAWLLRGPVNC